MIKLTEKPPNNKPDLRPPAKDTFLGKGGRYYHVGARQVDSWRVVGVDGAGDSVYGDGDSISRVIWDSAFHHPKVEPAKTAENGPEKRTSVHTIEKIIQRSSYETIQGKIDDAINRKIANELRKIGEDKRADNMGFCGVVRGQRECLNPECGKRQAPEVVTCHEHRLCPRCARIHARRLRFELEGMAAKVPKVFGLRWRLLTVTIKTDGEFKEALANLSQAFGKLWRDVLRWRWERVEAGVEVRERGGRFYCGKSRVFEGKAGQYWKRKPVVGVGAFRSVEFGSEHRNCHAHALLWSSYIPQEVISREWERLTSGSMVVDIRQIQPKGDEALTLADAIREVGKYVTKIGELPADKVVELWQATRGRHLTQRYGCFRQAMKTEEQLEEVACPECGCTRYRWIYVPFALAQEEHIRGPPADQVDRCQTPKALELLVERIERVYRASSLPPTWFDSLLERVVERSRQIGVN